MPAPPDWAENFQVWAAGLAPAALAEMIDLLARELERRGVGDHDVLREAARTVRGHSAARLCHLVDTFVIPAPCPADRLALSERGPSIGQSL